VILSKNDEVIDFFYFAAPGTSAVSATGAYMTFCRVQLNDPPGRYLQQTTDNVHNVQLARSSLYTAAFVHFV